ncbi:Bromodomain-containing protein, putative [Theobroma cacao]|uniref:Bromodomain-containing protein, putative n=1 Tax=Theobroma cacao TaxID=3641 RepID=A0A061GA05_THECC|nr:Bromodomain-containing protein, putative [Theobroma cacao]
MARFAATLGPVAWKVASHRIEQALPTGCKFGRGWVGEYEPLPTPVLMLENRAPKESALFIKLQRAADARKDDATYETPVPSTGVRKDDVTYNTAVPAKPHPLNVPASEGKSSSFRPVSGQHQKEGHLCLQLLGQSLQVELNLPPTANKNNADLITEKKNSNKSETAASKSREMVSRNMSLARVVSSKQIENNVAVDGGLPNGKISSNCFNNRAMNPSSDGIPTQMAKAAAYYSHGQEQGLNDPVQFMRILAEKAQKQQNSSNQFPQLIFHLLCHLFHLYEEMIRAVLPLLVHGCL